MPNHLQNRLQHLQNCAAGYIFGKYLNTLDVINLNWLPVAENTEFNISKLAYQGLHDKNWPEYLLIKLIKWILFYCVSILVTASAFHYYYYFFY